MDCRRVHEVVFLYADNEMEDDLVVDFQQHLELCPHCARRLEEARRLLILLRERCLRASAPERLRQRILTSFPHRRP
jgi:mycothiol system anti-sigma-R factor